MKRINWFSIDSQYSDVSDVMNDKKSWVYYIWGEVKEIHIIGVYGVIEYVRRNGDDKDKIYFHPVLWTDKYKEHHNNHYYWEDTNRSFHTLEEAIIDVIAYNFDGLNSQAGHYFSKMVGLSKE